MRQEETLDWFGRIESSVSRWPSWVATPLVIGTALGGLLAIMTLFLHLLLKLVMLSHNAYEAIRQIWK